MTYELSMCILKMILFYIVILSSVTIPTAKSQGDKERDFKGFGLVNLVLKLLGEQQMESARLSKLEERLKTYETTGPILNDRLERLEKNVKEINMKFNEIVTGANDKQIGFHRGIGDFVQKALISEKKERKKSVSSMNKIVNEHMDIIEKFQIEINNTLDKRFLDITAEQVEYKDNVEAFKEAIDRTIDKRFQDIAAKQVEYQVTIETFKKTMNSTIDKHFQDISAEQVECKDSVETLKVAINKTIDERFQEISAELVEYKDSVETFKVAINKTIDKRFQDITAEQVEHKDTIETFQVAINKTIDKRFQDFTAEQVEYKDISETFKKAINNTIDIHFQEITDEKVKYKETVETFKIAINNTIEERFEYIAAMQIKYRDEILLDLIALNETRYMVDTLGKIVEGGKVRLVNGSNQYEGRLEVWHDWSWRTVCDDGFDTLSASVVCRMLNFQHTNPVVFKSSYFGSGAFPLHLDKVKCSKTDTRISQCLHSGWGKHNCSHDRDVGISCTPVRLVNGSNQYEGRLEVWHNGSWGTVCDDAFTEMSATVVCKMLNYPHSNPMVLRSAHFGAGASLVHFDGVYCNGTETSITQCPHREWGITDCDHHKDVGISCTPVRLVNGSNQYEGRLEVWHDRSWGTVCGDGFDTLSASVVCKMLSFQHTSPRVYGSAQFGAGASLIHLDNVDCKGTETSITQCRHNGWGINDCDHREDVGISCTPVRLVNGSHPYEGRLEVWHDGSWGTVCGDDFTGQSATVVCKMLNYPHTNPLVFMSAYFGAGKLPIHLDDVECTGTEMRFLQCPHRSWGSNNCSHSEDVGISCTQVRLVSGSNQYEGRLEVWHNGSWGTVCDDEFGALSAKVVCKMLNYPHTNPLVLGTDVFGSGTLPIHLDNVICAGTETSLSQCSHNGWGSHNCGHSEDVGISCSHVRLVNGSSQYEGRLEVMHDGSWGTVCDNGFDTLSASVVCKMLDYPPNNTLVLGSAHFGAGTFSIYLDDVKCTGNETSLSQCTHKGWGKHNCSLKNVVGISCPPDVRLVNGSNQFEGRLEVWHNKRWGTVCHDYFDERDATVVCRILNYPQTNPLVFGFAHFGAGTLPIHLDHVQCRGTETSLIQCLHSPWGEHNCDHGEDVGISCTPVRLVNGSSQYEGRLEVWHDGSWGTVCDNGFDTLSASVVCKMLDYPPNNAQVFGSAHFGAGTLSIHLDYVKCTGNENTLSQCTHNGWGTHSCSHNDVVGISCPPDVRLVNGSNQFEGRLEVWHNKRWGTVCHDLFDERDATVVCRILNYPQTDSLVFQSAHFGAGSLPIHLDDVNCKGTETSLIQCLHRTWGEHDCVHGDDVGISCTPVRLVNGSNQYEGRLEVWHDGSWGTVCDDDFTALSARVVCDMLNYHDPNPLVHGSAHFGAGKLPIHLDDVKCTGTELSLFDCPHRAWGSNNCGHGEDVGITCTPTVRLVDGSSQYEGRLEVWHDNTWGTVCDDRFGTQDATVACKMLKYPHTSPVVHDKAHFGFGTGPILLDEVQCTGSETSLFQCSHDGWRIHDCDHGEDVGISCK